MSTVYRLVLLVALAAVGVWLWTILLPGPEKIVRKRLAQVAAEASFNSGENPLALAARCESLASRFSTNAEIHINVPENDRPVELFGRAEITEAAAGVRTMNLGSLKVEFPDVSVTIAPDKLSAIADVAVKVQAAGEKDVHVQEMKFIFQKVSGDWLITRVEAVRAPS